MCNRLHFEKTRDAYNVKALMEMRGYKVQVLRCGCIYEGGLILQLGESAFQFANQIVVAFSLKACIVM